MKRKIQYLFLFVFGALIFQSCNEIQDEYTYGRGLYPINWNAAADSATSSLIANFWNVQTHTFVYNAGNFEGGVDNNYWPQAHAMDAVIDAYLRTNDKKYSDLFGQWFDGVKYANFTNPGINYRNNYYDDSEWIALTMLRLYEVTKDAKYLDAAKDLWEWIKTGWNEQGGGGIAWEKIGHQYSKNACSNGPAAILAARLSKVTNNNDDLIWAQKIYEWEKANLFNQATGAVYDNLNANTGELSTMTLSYNQGTFLGSAYELYKITGDDTYLNDARKAANFTISDPSMIDVGNNVLRDEGNGDGGLFKGIFMRYFVQLILEPNLNQAYANKFTTFLNNNADVLWRKGTYKKEAVLFGQNWTTAPVLTTQLTSQISGTTLIEAKTYLDSHLTK